MEGRDMTEPVRTLIFTGNGKGKTTAALGMALRAAGHGLPVAIVQFVKSDATVGELRAAAALPGVTIVQTGRGFLPKPGDPALADHQAAAIAGLRGAEEILIRGEAAVVILDEICFAVARGLLDEREVLDVLERARPGTIVVLTGRGATDGLMAAADTVTEMREIKHGMTSGIQSQRGVEW
jgi:cob(I)alamin adenosyltransferase